MKSLAVAATLLLAGCGTVTPEAITSRAQEIQNITKLICKFVPTLGTVANILSGGTTMPAALIAQDICLAVTTAPLADGPRGGPTRLYGYDRKNAGVVIKGKFAK